MKKSIVKVTPVVFEELEEYLITNNTRQSATIEVDGTFLEVPPFSSITTKSKPVSQSVSLIVARKICTKAQPKPTGNPPVNPVNSEEEIDASSLK